MSCVPWSRGPNPTQEYLAHGATCLCREILVCLIDDGIGYGARASSFDFPEGFLTIRMKESNWYAARAHDDT